MGASLVGDDVWEYQSSEYQEAPSYPKLTFFMKQRLNRRIIYFLYACLQAFSKSIALAIFTPHAGIHDLMSTLV